MDTDGLTRIDSNLYSKDDMKVVDVVISRKKSIITALMISWKQLYQYMIIQIGKSNSAFCVLSSVIDITNLLTV